MKKQVRYDIKKYSKLKLYIGIFFKIGLAGIIAIVILSGVTLMYNNTGIHITNENLYTDYVWESSHVKTTMVEGFSIVRLDEKVLNNSHYKIENEKIDILLMGSSHMEAINVASDANVGYLLNELLVDDTTYNIGVSGNTIYNCANNLDSAVKYFKPNKYVIIETSNINYQ